MDERRLTGEVALMLVSLFVVSPFAVIASTPSPVPPTGVPTENFAWNVTRLNIVIYPNSTLPNWNDSDIGAAVNGVGVWYQAINDFAANYPHYNYLRQLYFATYIHGVNDSGITPDVTISFLSTLPGCSGCVGLTFIAYASGNVVPPIRIDVRLPGTTTLELQKVVSHEFAHAIGLGDAQVGTCLYSPDIMAYCTTDPVPMPSTLDVYALGTVYTWLISGNSSFTVPDPPAVSLPSSIPYYSLYPLDYYENGTATALGELASASSQITNLQDEVISLQSNNTQIQGQNSLLRANNTALLATNTGLKNNLTHLQNSYTALNESYNALQATLASLQSEYSALKASYSRLQANYTSLQGVYSTLQSNFNAALVLSKSAAQTITNQTATIASLNTRLSGLISQANDLRQEQALDSVVALIAVATIGTVVVWKRNTRSLPRNERVSEEDLGVGGK